MTETRAYWYTLAAIKNKSEILRLMWFSTSLTISYKNTNPFLGNITLMKVSNFLKNFYIKIPGFYLIKKSGKQREGNILQENKIGH